MHIQQCQCWTAPMIFIEKTAHFRRLKRTGYHRTNRPSDRPTDTTSYRDARTHLKRNSVCCRRNSLIGGCLVSGLLCICIFVMRDSVGCRSRLRWTFSCTLISSLGQLLLSVSDEVGLHCRHRSFGLCGHCCLPVGKIRHSKKRMGNGF